MSLNGFKDRVYKKCTQLIFEIVILYQNLPIELFQNSRKYELYVNNIIYVYAGIQFMVV